MYFKRSFLSIIALPKILCLDRLSFPFHKSEPDTETMKRKLLKILVRFFYWRKKNVPDKQFLHILSIIVGLAVGLAAVVIKNAVHFIQNLLHNWGSEQGENYLFILYPLVGITLVILYTNYLLRKKIGHGIPSVLFALSTKQGRINSHNMFSSIIASAFTVGFGGSVGLEGPTVATGAAIGSNIGRILRLNYKQIVLLLGCACAGAMAAIFKAPVAAIVFALEVIMLNLSMSSIVSLLLASFTATLTSYIFMGQNVLYPFELEDAYGLVDVPSFIVLGIIAGFVAVYFKRMYVCIEKIFDKIKNKFYKLLIGGGTLGILIFFFPALYGEGYEEINMSLNSDFSYLFNDSVFSGLNKNIYTVVVLFVAIILLKVIATSVTFGSGGVGGIFAPTLFMGSNLGLLVAVVFHYADVNVSHSNFALLGMGGMIAGVLHAPLTSIFLIADLTGGYGLFLPLMIVSTFSYATVKLFESNSVYTYQLARRRQLLTHDKDKAVLTLMNLKKLIERDFSVVHPDATLGELVEVIKKAHRNIFPVVDENGTLHGIVKLDDIRELIFDQKQYRKVDVRSLMFWPEYFLSPEDSMENVVKIIQDSGRYNFPVLHNGKYMGFISRAKVFSAYRQMTAYFSEE